MERLGQSFSYCRKVGNGERINLGKDPWLDSNGVFSFSLPLSNYFAIQGLEIPTDVRGGVLKDNGAQNWFLENDLGITDILLLNGILTSTLS